MCAQFDGTNVLIALIIFYHTYTIFLTHDSNCKTLQLTIDNNDFYPYRSKIKIKQTSKHEQNIIITYSYSVLISVKLPQITVKLL